MQDGLFEGTVARRVGEGYQSAVLDEPRREYCSSWSSWILDGKVCNDSTHFVCLFGVRPVKDVLKAIWFLFMRSPLLLALLLLSDLTFSIEQFFGLLCEKLWNAETGSNGSKDNSKGEVKIMRAGTCTMMSSSANIHLGKYKKELIFYSNWFPTQGLKLYACLQPREGDRRRGGELGRHPRWRAVCCVFSAKTASSFHSLWASCLLRGVCAKSWARE